MKVSRTRYVALLAILSAISTALMFWELPVPVIMPAFIKFDFSDLPALIGSFTLGPLAGVIICLVKNLIHLSTSGSMYIGELANFLMGVAFVLPAGLIYKYKHNKKYAIIACLVGALSAGILCFPINLWIIYPLYDAYMVKMEIIVGMYTSILKSVHSLELALLIFNVPFTFIKCLIVAIITMIIYKPLSPIMHGYGKFAIGKEKNLSQQPTEPVIPDAPKDSEVVIPPTGQIEDKPVENTEN